MPEENSSFETKTLSTPAKRFKLRRVVRRFKRWQVILLAVIIVVAFVLYRSSQEREQLASQLEQTTAELDQIRQATKKDSQDAAQEVLDKLRKHIVVPDEPEPTVAAIVDVESLKQANRFYEPAQNGDYLILTERRAILYDPELDVILDVVPVQVGSEAATPSPTATASPSRTRSEAVSPSPTSDNP